jgi:hypothetical protein
VFGNVKSNELLEHENVGMIEPHYTQTNSCET